MSGGGYKRIIERESTIGQSQIPSVFGQLFLHQYFTSYAIIIYKQNWILITDQIPSEMLNMVCYIF